MLPKGVRKTPEIYFVGNSISSKYIRDLQQVLEGKDFSINIISKSGTTTEPAIAFRVFKEMLVNKYGKDEASKRIYATTDKARGALKNLADQEGYEEFVVPDDVGGRYSVLTAVGLLPIAVSGANIDKLMEGAASGRKKALELPYETNAALQYAAVRNILLRKGKQVEITANYEPSLHYVSEWWKQLFGESEGKDRRGIFPASVDLTTDCLLYTSHRRQHFPRKAEGADHQRIFLRRGRRHDGSLLYLYCSEYFWRDHVHEPADRSSLGRRLFHNRSGAGHNRAHRHPGSAPLYGELAAAHVRTGVDSHHADPPGRTDGL